MIETLLGVAVLAIVSFGVYQSLNALLDIFTATKVKTAAASLANEQMEIIRNIAYSQVGTVGGIPAGAIPQTQTFTRDNLAFLVTTTVRNIDDPFDGTLGGTPNDTSPADYKLVELAITCTSCRGAPGVTITGRVAPKALEGISTNGALFVQAIDASGQFISGATVQVVNSVVNPAVNLTDVTNANGALQLVDVIPAAQSYQITVSKAGFSSDQTYTASPQNPNPVKLHATVVAQTVTQASFQIDRVSAVNFSGVTPTCGAVGNIAAQMTGAKLIGTNPNVPKYSQSHAIPASGALAVGNLEWDTYTLAFSHATQDVAGTIPLAPLTLTPNTTQNFKIVMQPKQPQALLVTVKDGATGLPLSDAAVTITRPGFSAALTTGRGFLRQTDWSGGSGQAEIGDLARYAADDGNAAVANPAGEIKLLETAPLTYAASGWLESSTFDTGATSTFYQFAFLPGSQPPDAGPDAVRFQIATATTTAPSAWSFVGPDGTAATYFTASNGNVNGIHTGDRYLRYKAYLQTASTTFTPSVSDVAITFSSACVPPGQVLFTGLVNDTYAVDVGRSGYAPGSDSATVAAPWQEKIINLVP